MHTHAQAHINILAHKDKNTVGGSVRLFDWLDKLLMVSDAVEHVSGSTSNRLFSGKIKFETKH